MNDKIKEFIKLKKCSEYKIEDDEIICNLYPEDYYFIRKESNKWIYGESHREIEKVVKEFEFKEEAMLCLLYKLYTIKKSIELKRPYVKEWSQMSNDELRKQIDTLFEITFLKQLEILNDEQLIYKQKHIINNSFYERSIEEFRVFKLFSLKAFNQTKQELVDFGIEESELDKYFRYENLVDL